MEEFALKFTENYNVSRETFERICTYVELLKKWQAKINLISPTTINEIWIRHIEDSLQLLNKVPRETSAIIDLGSGGGLPGIILSIAQDKPVYLIESDVRKCSFLTEAARACNITNCKVINNRAENAKIDGNNLNEVLFSARAFAELDKIFEICAELIKNNRVGAYKMLLPKGKTAAIELDKAKLKWDFDFVSHKTVTDDEGAILLISNIRRKL